MSKAAEPAIIAGVNVLLILTSSLLLPLALPNEAFPMGLTAPGLVALVPALLVVMRTRHRRAASRYGALFGAISTAVANYWLAFFGDFSVWTIGGTVIGYTGYNYILFGFLHFVFHRSCYHDLPGGLSTDGEGRRVIIDTDHAARGLYVRGPILLAAAWTGYEYLKSVGFVGYPWGLIAYPVGTGLRVAQIAEITGIWGLSFLGAYLNAAVATLLYKRETSIPVAPQPSPHPQPWWAPQRRVVADRSTRSLSFATRHLTAALLLFALAIAFGAYRLPHLEPTGRLEMLLVQQNINSWQPGRFTEALDRAQRVTLDALVHDAETGRPPVDAVVWSETSLRVPYSPEHPFYAEEPPSLPFRFFLRLIDVPLITGTPLPANDRGDYHNSAVVITPDGSIAGSYAKQQLVPFAESIPFWHSPLVREFFRGVIGLTGTWLPGTSSEPITLPLRGGGTIEIGTPICFEDGFGWVPREMVRSGARLLVNLTNNSWSRQNSAQTQHYVAARFRSIELRTTLVRGTNSGLSGVVDARGVLIDEMPMFESAAKRVSVPIYPDRWTLYRAWGDWLGIACAVGTLGWVVFVAIRRRR